MCRTEWCDGGKVKCIPVADVPYDDSKEGRVNRKLEELQESFASIMHERRYRRGRRMGRKS